MKFAKKLLLGLVALSLFSAQVFSKTQDTLENIQFVVVPESTQCTADDTALLFDIDDVVIGCSNLMKLSIIAYGLSWNPIKTYAYIQTLRRIQKRYTKIDGHKILFDENNNEINGVTFQFLYNGMKDKDLLPYAAGLAAIANTSRHFISGTKTILE